MGKQRRQRTKFHISNKISGKNIEDGIATTNSTQDNTNKLMFIPESDLFAGLNIDINSISKKLPEDTLSKVSFRSNKPELGKHLPKKDKLKLKKEMLLKKIDAINQLKKENKLRSRRKRNAIIGDTNPLHDALPTLESLVDKQAAKTKNSSKCTLKGIQKVSRRKKELKQNIMIFKNLLKKQKIKNNPFVNV